MKRDEKPLRLITVQAHCIVCEVGRLFIVGKQIDTSIAHDKERDPRFMVRDIYAHSLKPFVEVKDTINNLIVAFTSESEYVLYFEVILHD